MIPYFDAHCDTLYRCLETGNSPELDYGTTQEEQRKFFAACEGLRQNGGHIDLTRCQAFSRSAQFYAIFHDAKYPPQDGMWAACRRIYDFFLLEMERNQDCVVYCRNGNEIDAAVSEGKSAAVLSIEGADLIECDMAKIETVASWVVRMMNPVWNRPNILSGSHAADAERGLSDYGQEFIRELYRCGIYPDVSHLSERGFWDLAELAEGPIIASHSNAKALCGHSRNLTDEQFCAIRDSGGVVGINLYRDFVGDDSMDTLVAHVEHFLHLNGEKTVCLGGDLDGCEVLAAGMAGMEDMPQLYDALASRGYSEALLEDLFWNNLRCMF